MYQDDNKFCTCAPREKHTERGRATTNSATTTNTRECISIFEGHAAHTSGSISRASIRSFNKSLAWTPDGKHLLSAGTNADTTIREWDSMSWEQVGGSPWKGHDKQICAIAVNSAATLVASASYDNDICLWWLLDK